MPFINYCDIGDPMNEHRQIKINNLLDTDPRKIRYHEVLKALADAPEERVKKAFAFVPLEDLRTLRHFFDDAIENHKRDRMEIIVEAIRKETDITIEDVVYYALDPSKYIKEHFKHF